MLGMLLSKLDEGTLREIFLIYDRLLGGAGQNVVLLAKENPGSLNSKDYPVSWHVARIKQVLGVAGATAVDIQLGSSFEKAEGDTKLIVWDEGRFGEDRLVRFALDANQLEPEKVEGIEKIFRQEVEFFLFSRGLAVYIESDGHYARLEEIMGRNEPVTEVMWLVGLGVRMSRIKRNFLHQTKLGNMDRKFRPVCLRIEDLEKQVIAAADLYTKEKKKPTLEDKKTFLNEYAIICDIVGCLDETAA